MTQLAWQKRTQWPLVAFGLVFLAAYSAEVIGDLSPEQSTWIDVVIWVTWAAFCIDYGVNLILAERRSRWFVRNIWQLLLLALPVLRPLRLLRLVTLVRIFDRTGGMALRGRMVAYVSVSACLLVYVGALAVLDAEQDAPGANIRSFGNALWWAVTTITTVGYGDYAPVTVVGRLVAVGLMVSGIAVLGVVTAGVASWLLERVRVNTAEQISVEDQPMVAEISKLSAQVEQLAATLSDMRLPSAGCSAWTEQQNQPGSAP